MEKLGSLIIYSLSTSISIDPEEFREDAISSKVPLHLLPNPINGVLPIKQIRKMLVDAFNYCYGINIRCNGGVVFIPEDMFPEWNRIMLMLFHYEGIDFQVIGVYSTPVERGVLLNRIKSEIDVFYKKEIAHLNDKGKGDITKGSVDVINNCLRRVKYMQCKTEVYSDILSSDLGGRREKMKNLCDMLCNLFEKKDKERKLLRMFA